MGMVRKTYREELLGLGNRALKGFDFLFEIEVLCVHASGFLLNPCCVTLLIDRRGGEMKVSERWRTVAIWAPCAERRACFELGVRDRCVRGCLERTAKAVSCSASPSDSARVTLWPGRSKTCRNDSILRNQSLQQKRGVRTSSPEGKSQIRVDESMHQDGAARTL